MIPNFLSEPFVRTVNWARNPQQEGAPIVANPSFCGPAQIVEEVAARPRGFVPHHLPGQNEFLPEYSVKSGIPMEALRGGAETMLPEYQVKLQELMKTDSRQTER